MNSLLKRLGLPLLLSALLLAGTAHAIQPTRVIESPTAGLLGRGGYGFSLGIYPNGGVLANFQLGLFRWVDLGFSYGGEQLIGESKPNWNPAPGILLRLRPLEESTSFPALALGFESQGWGPWDKAVERYQVKSKGLYIVASKNWLTLGGNLGLHAGTNYSFEDKDGQKHADFFLGADKDIWSYAILAVDYQGGLNDAARDSSGSLRRGYLNVAVKVEISPNFELEFDFKNLLLNRRDTDEISRELRVTFNDAF